MGAAERQIEDVTTIQKLVKVVLDLASHIRCHLDLSSNPGVVYGKVLLTMKSLVKLYRGAHAAWNGCLGVVVGRCRYHTRHAISTPLPHFLECDNDLSL